MKAKESGRAPKMNFLGGKYQYSLHKQIIFVTIPLLPERRIYEISRTPHSLIPGPI